MAEISTIEWTDATWNPITGCSVVSPGCTNCYAMRLAGTRLQNHPSRVGLTRAAKAGPVWTGEVRLNEQWLTQPLQWGRPRKIFVCAHGDLFAERVPDEWIDRVFAVMALAPQHTFQVLTKRAGRMRSYLSAARAHPVGLEAMEFTLHEMTRNPRSDVGRGCILQGDVAHLKVWPLPNVWLGVSAEDQRRADERVPDLLVTPAAVRFMSAEPLLGAIDLDAAWHGETALDAECWGECAWCEKGFPPLHNCQRGLGDWEKGRSGLDWVIAGGESGPGARPMHPYWARLLREQCAAADVPFHFKQWGAWAPVEEPASEIQEDEELRGVGTMLGRQYMRLVGKKSAGRLLDGVEHDGMPEAAHVP